MNKYIFTDRFGKKVTKYEIVAETLGEAQMQLSAKLEIVRGISVVGVGLPDYVEPVDYPADITLKTFNITYRPDPDVHSVTETITYKAESMKSAHGKFINDYPEQAGQYRETHSPLSNYDSEPLDSVSLASDTIEETPADSEGSTESERLQDELEPIDVTTTKQPDEPTKDESSIFPKVTEYVSMVTSLLVSIIGLGLVAHVIFGRNLGLDVVGNIQGIINSFPGFAGLVTLFIIFYIFNKRDGMD